MLKELKIKNFVLVNEMTINFGDKLTVMTGETGAGKSVIAGALHIVLGENVRGDVFFDNSKSVEIEATFGMRNAECGMRNETLIDLLTKYEIDTDDDELFFLRELKPDGKSSIYINGRKTTNAIVKEFRNVLLDFHSQRDQQSLFDEETQLLYLDKFADLITLRDEYFSHFTQWQETIKKLKQYQEDIKKNEEKILLYQYQIEELQSANLKENEETELDSEHHLLLNAKEILDYFYQMKADFFEGESTVYDQLSYYKKRLETYATDNKIIANTVENLLTAITALDDISASINFIDEEISVDENRLTEVENRIKTIYELKQKYRKDITQMKDYIAEMRAFIDGYKLNVDTEGQLTQQVAILAQKTSDLAERLHNERLTHAKDFERQIIDALQKLAIVDADFKIIIEKIDNLNETGGDKVKYLFSANKGSPLQDLKSTISGGELSRLLLVIKSILAKKLPERTIIFDEIDSGIGGKTANMLGQFISDLSSSHQILCISHLPQVAALADHHLKIEKVSQTERSIITVHKLDHNSRTNEIARMLSGNITQTALEHAQELLRLKIETTVQ